MRVVVIGAGMGGLFAALAARRAGHEVLLLEATDHVGGLAASVVFDGHRFDGGPYVLLDLPGLRWAFEQVGERLEDHVALCSIDHAWRVTWPDGDAVDLWADVEATATGFDRREPGAGERYRRFVAWSARLYDALAPLQRTRRPSPLHLLRPDRIEALPFLLRPLGAHLRATGLSPRLQQVVGVWTHVAGLDPEVAPAPMVFVPQLVHRHGAAVVEGGIGRVPEAVERLVRAAGVEVRLGTPVTAVVHDGRRVRAVRTADAEIPADVVVGNAPALSLLLERLDPPVPVYARRYGSLPLQGPGVSAWLTARVRPDVPFLTFRLDERGGCALRIAMGAVDPTRPTEVRVLAPVPHGTDEPTARAALDRLLAADWWREGLDDVVVRGTRTPRDWARAAWLYRESMNPAMTASFLRRGRVPHVPGRPEGLLLAGSATHPGQWVSFCAISGVLAAGVIGG